MTEDATKATAESLLKAGILKIGTKGEVDELARESAVEIRLDAGFYATR